MNRVVLIGNMTRDAELKYTPSGVAMAKFGVAINRNFKNASGEKEVDFINIDAWRKDAEFISQYGGKGRKVAISGRLQIHTYVGQDGLKKSVTSVVADNVELLDSPRGGQDPNQEVDASMNVQDSFADPFEEVR